MVSFTDLPLNDDLAEKIGGLKMDFAFQPIFKKSSMERVGYEALMRPLGCTPLQLIEEYSMIGGLHTLELATFFGASKAYCDRSLKGMVSINSFPSECFDREESKIFFQCFPDIAKEMFVEILEYTELNLDKWILKRDQIRANGIRISLDDFGSGNNNSMVAVNVFQPNGVKIDRSIITDIHKSKQKQERLLGLIDDFHKRNIHVLAEALRVRKSLISFLQRMWTICRGIIWECRNRIVVIKQFFGAAFLFDRKFL